MLDGFVVPHAHFRVFHGNAAGESAARTPTDQLALVFQPRRADALPTDLHVREFAQLEAQIKALQQQQQPSLSSRLLSVAESAPLSECFSFYARLFTPESFTWPDFLTIVVTKLVEHFVASDSDLVRKAIFDVLCSAPAHVARVTEATKITTLLKGLLGQQESTVWALQLVGTMPSLVKDDPSIRMSLLRAMQAECRREKSTAVDAARGLLLLCPEFRPTVFTQTVNTKSAVLVSLIPAAFAEGDRQEMEQAWNLCASLFHDQVGDEDALECLRAAGDIATKYADCMVARHLQLVRYVVTKDPRPNVVSNVWSTCEDLWPLVAEPTDQAEFLDIVTLQLRSETENAAQCCAIRALNIFCKHQSAAPAAVVACARKIASRTRLHRQLFVQLLGHCARWELANIGSQVPANNRIQDLPSVNELIQFLKPTQFQRERRIWETTATKLGELVSTFPDQIGTYAGDCYLQLVRLARRKLVDRMEAALWLSLSRICVHCPHVIVENAELLLSDSLLSFDATTKQAVAVCLVGASRACSLQDRDTWMNWCLRLTIESENDRYTVARVALSHGSPEFAGRLLRPVAETIDHDVFGSWLRGLVAISDASIIIKTEEFVTIDAYHQLAEGKSYFQAVTSAQWALDFQIAFVNARLRWMELMLQAQQLAGEIAHSRRTGGCRELQLSDSFRENANEFHRIRSRMLCSSSSDRDVLIYHSQLSSLMAEAIVQFLVQDLSKQSSKEDTNADLPSSHAFSSSFSILSSLKSDAQDKARRLWTLNAARRPLAGSSVFVQLLRATCTLPMLMPRQFFRSQSRPTDRVRCNLQFLTQAEKTSASSKPRSRSQLGVAAGSEFTSSLYGAVAFPRVSSIQPRASALHVTVFLSVEKTDVVAVEGSTQPVSEMTLTLATPSASTSSTEWMYVPVETPIVVPGELLKNKGTYSVHATVRLGTTSGETWELAPTGGSRGLIVY